MDKRKFIRSTLLSWIIFIGIDFLMHASILEKLWAEEIEAIKPSLDLAILIPVGYFSFLLLTLLVGFVFVRVYPIKPEKRSAFRFALLFGGLYALSNLLGVYSYVDIPIGHLILFNLVYFIEIVAVVFVYYNTYYNRDKTKKQNLLYTIYFFTLLVAGVIIQNII